MILSFEMEHKKFANKKCIFYLIQAFLVDNGFTESAECFRSEADLSNEYTICDNITLETIITEFQIYYYQRFKTNPQLYKRVTAHVPAKLSAKRSVSRSRKSTTLNVECESNGTEVSQLRPDFVLCNIPQTCYTSHTDADNVNTEMPDEDEDLAFSDERRAYQNMILQNIDFRKINVQWQDIKGVVEVKQLLREAFIYPIRYPYLFTGVVEPWRSILMYGPPGTGKTLLANAVVTESNATFFNITSSLIVNKWRGDTEKLIKVLFDLARKRAPSIIFIDEIDALALKRNIHEHEASRRLKSELFYCIDKMTRSADKVFLLATTNSPWDIDEAMLRRFEKHVYVPPPDEETRKLLLQHFLPKTISTNPIIEIEFDYDFTAKITEKYTGCDLKNICKDIKINLMREVFSRLESDSKQEIHVQEKKIISHEDLKHLFNKFKPIYVRLEDKYLKWTTEFDYKFKK